jgi:anaphase-promoting complex subunit 4
VVSGLQNLRALVHENFIPALERCGIILSRLAGIARFHDSRESIGFTATQISRLMDIVSCLTVVSHKILLVVMDELEHFTMFSSWLRLEIDLLASSTITEELSEKEATMDNAKVMAYIQRYLLGSPLALYFDEVTKEDYTKDRDLIEDGASLLQMLEKQLKRQESGVSYMRALPHIDFLVNYLTSRANTVFRDIAEAEKRSVRFGQATELSTGQKIWKHDTLVCPRRKNVRSRLYPALRAFFLLANNSVLGRFGRFDLYRGSPGGR